MKISIFEDFIEYCKEDNKKLAQDIEIWLADYFDLPNRCIPITKDEKKWIKENLSKKNQIRILGKVIDDSFQSMMPNKSNKKQIKNE